MSKLKELTSRLFIEKDDDNNHEVVIRVGPVVNEMEAVNIASYIYVTQNLDVTEIIKPVNTTCLLYTSPSPRDGLLSRMPSSA